MPRSTQVDAGRTAAPVLLLALVDGTLGAGSRRFPGASAVGHSRFGLGSGYGELLIRPGMTCLVSPLDYFDVILAISRILRYLLAEFGLLRARLFPLLLCQPHSYENEQVWRRAKNANRSAKIDSIKNPLG